ncbi:hypothetical protein BJP44_10215 [Candidatus Williamhamiltonella defendens]|uniref:hypothetical protein n=1 Tax=Candidatus Williamhamiltonella defendens TaxID=138072 RepID=UPI000C1EE692|nr:hypothetical protein [Candidatus Hamiltonella defensa]ATW23350.1 hypothetical protein BJP44_10215 [Candidatus Hamiltonella defensa]
MAKEKKSHFFSWLGRGRQNKEKDVIDQTHQSDSIDLCNEKTSDAPFIEIPPHLLKKMILILKIRPKKQDFLPD